MTPTQHDLNQPQLRRAGVVGFPVAQSLSPKIFQHWFAAQGIKAQYDKIEVKPGEIKALLPALRKSGYLGLNVTLPLKREALHLADVTTDVAATIGAANCLSWKDNLLYADNTDVAGEIGALATSSRTRHGKNGFAGSKVVLLGSGGAARSMLYTLLMLGVGHITMFNRTKQNAEALASDLAPVNASVEITVGEWNSLGLNLTKSSDSNASDLAKADLIINATSLGMMGKPPMDIDLRNINSAATVFDMVYKPLQTDLLAAAASAGAETIHGLHMLVHQAVPAFVRWFGGKTPDANATVSWLAESL